MIKPVIDCMIVTVIKTTLAICNYTACNEECMDYLLTVSNECPVVFHNGVYEQLWQTLIPESSLCKAFFDNFGIM